MRTRVTGLLTALVLLAQLLVGAAPALAASVAGTFVSLSPTRILDTRTGTGVAGPVGPDGAFRLRVAGVGSVPASGVAAVVMNLTATAATAPGFVTAFPSGTSRPGTSNLNFGPGQDVANLAVVAVGADGTITLVSSSSGNVQLVADLAGYYVGGTPSTPGAFAPLSPARVLDTRVGLGASGAVSANATISAPIAGRGGVPASGVSAVALNVTVTDPSANGFLTAFPNGMPLPSASNLNFGRGQTVANLAIVKLGSDGRLAFTNSSAGSTQIVADVAGYFLAGTPTEPGAFVPVNPTRLLDSRTRLGASGPVRAGDTIQVRVAGRAGLPASGVAAVVLNLTVTQPTASGLVTAYPDLARRPNASNLNYLAGQTLPNLAIVKVGGDGYLDLYVGGWGSAQVVADVAGYVLGEPTAPVVGVDAPGTSVSSAVSRQVVVATLQSATRGVVTWYAWTGSSWRQDGSVTASFGYGGPKSGSVRVEGDGSTPLGTFRLLHAFGTNNPGSSLPFRTITGCSWWVSKGGSDYNRWREDCSTALGGTPSEKLLDFATNADQQYRNAIATSFNYDDPIQPYGAGSGSSIFVHYQPSTKSTAGCIGLNDRAMLAALITWLDPAANPQIVIRTA